MTMPTFTNGSVVHAASFTTLETGINSLHTLGAGAVFPQGYVPVANMTVNAPISIPNGADTVVRFPATTINNDNIWVASVTEVYPNRPGYYIATAQVNFAANATGVRAGHILLNGTSIPSNSVAAGSQLASSLGQGNVFTMTSPPLLLTVNSAIRLSVFQDSGAALNLIPLLSGAYLSLIYVGQ